MPGFWISPSDGMAFPRVAFPPLLPSIAMALNTIPLLNTHLYFSPFSKDQDTASVLETSCLLNYKHGRYSTNTTAVQTRAQDG